MSGDHSAERLRALRQALPPVGGPLRARERIRQLASDIRLARSVEESLQAAPPLAGPFNSQAVVVRALQRLQAVSPAYVRGVVAQLDALGAVERLSRPG